MTHEQVADAYRRYGHLVLRRCKRILRNDAAAEEALQDVFVRLWRYGDSFAEADSKVSWLYRVAERCCFDQLARRRPETPLQGDVPQEALSQTQALEDREVVMRFLERFDDRVKQVAVLHFIDEMSQDEIAKATGWSRQTISKKLAFLRERAACLRAQLCGSERVA